MDELQHAALSNFSLVYPNLGIIILSEADMKGGRISRFPLCAILDPYNSEKRPFFAS